MLASDHLAAKRTNISRVGEQNGAEGECLLDLIHPEARNTTTKMNANVAPLLFNVATVC